METSTLEFKWMSIFTESQMQFLLANGKMHLNDHNCIPGAYLKGKDCEWLISELYEDNPHLAFGLFSSEQIPPRIGFIELKTFDDFRREGRYIFNKPGFETQTNLLTFKAVSETFGRVTIDEDLLDHVFNKLRHVD